MGIYKQVDNANLEQLKEWWNSKTPEWAHSRESFLEEIAYALSEYGSEGVNYLKGYAPSDIIELRSVAIYFLAKKNIIDNEILTYLTDAFYDEDIKLKTSALWGFINTDEFPLERSKIEELFRSGNERLAALAMVYLSQAYPEERSKILQKGILSSNPRMREYACDEVGDKRIVELQQIMTQLLNDTDSDVRQSAVENLKLLK